MQARFRVVRRSGVLFPGFSKHMTWVDGAATMGITYLWRLRIGAFDVEPHHEAAPTDAVALRYRTWPVTDVLCPPPTPDDGSADCRGCFRLPGGRLVTFCRFALVPLR